jgi:hypothetical protein
MAATQALPVVEATLPAEHDRLKRRQAVDSVLGTTLAEGVSPGPQVIALSERYVAGEITLQELGTAVRAMSGL